MASAALKPARTRKVHFVANSMMGYPVSSFDRREDADGFRDRRAEKGVGIKLVKVTTITEELE